MLTDTFTDRGVRKAACLRAAIPRGVKTVSAIVSGSISSRVKRGQKEGRLFETGHSGVQKVQKSVSQTVSKSYAKFGKIVTEFSQIFFDFPRETSYSLHTESVKAPQVRQLAPVLP